METNSRVIGSNRFKVSDNHLREEVVEYMIVNSLSVAALARECNMSRRTIERFINGSMKPSLLTRLKFIKLTEE